MGECKPFISRFYDIMETIFKNIDQQELDKWFKEQSPFIISLTTFVFLLIAVVLGILLLFFAVILRQPDAWDNWIQKVFKITATLCKFFALIILLLNAVLFIKFFNKINIGLNPQSDSNTNLKSVSSLPILLIIGVILFIPSSINLLLLYILYGYIKAVSILRSTGLDNQTWSTILSIIEHAPTLSAAGLLILSIILLIVRRKKETISTPIIFTIALLVFLFFSIIIDKIIEGLIISPISTIHNHNIGNESVCNNVVVDTSDYIVSIIVIIVMVLFYLFFLFLYGLGGLHPTFKPSRMKIYNKLTKAVLGFIDEKIITPDEKLNHARLTDDLGASIHTGASFVSRSSRARVGRDGLQPKSDGLQSNRM